MLVDAVLPAASEAVMVYGGAVAAGAFAGQGTSSSAGSSTRLPGVTRDRARRHGRLHGRRDRRLVDRPARRAAVPRAPRPLAAPERGEARSRRSAGSSAGRTGPSSSAGSRLSSAPSSPSRLVSSCAVPPLHRPDADRLGDLVLRPRGGRLGARQQWEDFHRAFHYVDYAILATMAAGAAYLSGKRWATRKARNGAPARLWRP